MLNNSILDVAIGVVFIFLLYSLLATSIQEAIATFLGLRARTLKDGIVNGMLCDTPDISRWQSILKNIIGFFTEIKYLFFKRPKVADEKLGQQFYDHPLIKNYGSSQVFPTPSYIPTGNFSVVLVDLLKDDFNKKIDDIAAYKFGIQTGSLTIQQIKQNLLNSADILKISELLAYYAYIYATFQDDDPLIPKGLVIARDTLKIFQMHFRNSQYLLQNFEKELESWFDDTMNRVTGWYKRQVQFILFSIGLLMAIVFNGDIIQIAGKLHTDPDARAQLVNMAIKQADGYKEDPRVQKLNPVTDSVRLDSISANYRKPLNDARKTIDSGILKASQLLALGWGDYGMHRDSVKLLIAYYAENGSNCKASALPVKTVLDSAVNAKDAENKSKAILSALDILATTKVPTNQKFIADTFAKYHLAIEDNAISAIVNNFYKDYKDTTKSVTPKATPIVAPINKKLPVKKGIAQKAPNKAVTDTVKKAITKITPQSISAFHKFSLAYTALKNKRILDGLYTDNLHWLEIKYVFGQLRNAKKILGILITAFAICLGAPFWFDLLGKFINIRAAGKKEDTASTDTSKTNPPTQPVNITVQGPSATGEEAAVG